eukprot:1248785-Ditylum_brightwellii.AAC.1
MEKSYHSWIFTIWPGLTVDMVNTYLEKSTARAKCYMAQQCQHLQTTGKMTPLPPFVHERTKQSPSNNSRSTQIKSTSRSLIQMTW